jgi:DNA primase
MPSHGSSSVEKIKERLTIEDVVGSYIKLDKAGKNFKGRCPFHNEKTPSFFVSPDRGGYYCFGCNAKGDIFTFVEQFEGLDFMGALKLLAGKAGVKLEFDRNADIHKTEKEKLLAIMEEATAFFEKGLAGSKEAQEYIKGRGITEETAKNFRLGFIPNEWRLLYTHLKNKKYSDVDIEKAGLAKRPEGGEQKQPYDRFRGRIMFPISDSSGRVIAFSGRILVDDEKSAKYLNSPDTILFNKSTVLYGIDKAKADIRIKNYSILVEGQMDLVLSHQAGIKNTVAVSGTALSDTLMSRDNIVNNLGIVKRLSNNIILAFDSDAAGKKAALRSAAIALGLGMDVKIARVEGGKDPADLVKENPELWKNVLRNSKPVVESVLDDVLSQKLDPRKLPQALRDNVFPFIAPLTGAMEKAHYIRILKERTGLSEESIIADLKKTEALQKSEIREVRAVQDVQTATNRLDSISRKLFGLLLYIEKNNIQGFDVAGIKNALQTISGSERFDALERHSTASASELLLEAEVTYGSRKDSEGGIRKELDELLVNFEEDVIREEFAKIAVELAISEKNKDEAKVGDLMKKFQDLSRRKDQLSKKK